VRDTLHGRDTRELPEFVIMWHMAEKFRGG